MLRYLLGALSAILCSGLAISACGDSSTSPSPSPTTTITNDADLFGLVTQREPFRSYTPFPRFEGMAPAAGPHRTQVRVSLNQRALGALQNGRLPSGTRFPDGSVVFKEVINDAGVVTSYAVMYKASADSRAGSGWLWADFSPSGSVGYSIDNRGAMCTGCHMDAQGSQNDSVRVFERQR